MAGLLLIVPGFLSDIAGLALLLLPPVRSRVARFLERHVTVVKPGSTRTYPGGGPVIEGEAIEVGPEHGPNSPPPSLP
ncbi:MAG: FxsA family protein [Rhizobiales bacterium]|nr:FxsA family protein [Hyphomicrobiales bacterium]